MLSGDSCTHSTAQHTAWSTPAMVCEVPWETPVDGISSKNNNAMLQCEDSDQQWCLRLAEPGCNQATVGRSQTKTVSTQFSQAWGLRGTYKAV